MNPQSHGDGDAPPPAPPWRGRCGRGPSPLPRAACSKQDPRPPGQHRRGGSPMRRTGGGGGGQRPSSPPGGWRRGRAGRPPGCSGWEPGSSPPPTRRRSASGPGRPGDQGAAPGLHHGAGQSALRGWRRWASHAGGMAASRVAPMPAAASPFHDEGRGPTHLPPPPTHEVEGPLMVRVTKPHQPLPQDQAPKAGHPQGGPHQPPAAKAPPTGSPGTKLPPGDHPAARSVPRRRRRCTTTRRSMVVVDEEHPEHSARRERAVRFRSKARVIPSRVEVRGPPRGSTRVPGGRSSRTRASSASPLWPGRQEPGSSRPQPRPFRPLRGRPWGQRHVRSVEGTSEARIPDGPGAGRREGESRIRHPPAPGHGRVPASEEGWEGIPRAANDPASRAGAPGRS